MVPGKGAPPEKAIAVILGEAPGSTEEQDGEPFVGQSGRLLRAVLRGHGIPEEAIYFTNVVKCRPPRNNITAAHTCSCAPNLPVELKPYTKAKVPIFALGKVAQEAIIGRSSKSLQGHWYNKGRIYAGWHPAHILRKPAIIYDFVNDIGKIMNGGPVQVGKVGYKVMSSSDELQECYLDWVKRGIQLLCIDIEANQTNWWKDEILGIGIAVSSTEAVIIPEELCSNVFVKDILISIFANFEVVGHNFKFDAKFLRYQLHVPNAKPTYDSLIAHYVLNENVRHGLKGLLRQYFDIEDYEKVYVDRYLKSRNDNWRKVPRDSLYQYCALDVCYNYLLWGVLRHELEECGQFDMPFMFPLMESQETLIEVELHGMEVSVDSVRKFSRELSTTLATRKEELCDMAGASRDTNFNSWMQVGPIMYGNLKLPKVKGRGFKEGSTSAPARDKIMSRIPPDSLGYKWLAGYGQWKKLEKMRNSYVDNLLAKTCPEGRAHPDFLVYGTEVGRLSARGPAIQTIPRANSADVEDVKWGAAIRGLFCARPGYSIMEVDYSQAELRVAACLSHDEFLTSVYLENRDLHSEVAAEMYNNVYTKEQRVLCKMFNFSYLYGGSEYSFAADSGLSVPVARAFVRRYNQVMKGLTAWKGTQLALMTKQGYVETPFKRRRHMLLVNQNNLDDARKSCVHAPVAGTASDLTLISMIRTHNALRERNLDAHILATVHDSNIFEVENSVLEEVGRLAQKIMEEVGHEYFPEIPWKVDVETGPDWGHITDLFN
jgi:DNA polymerase-1